jgi:predicted SAM-dependent methyltransferase
MFRRLKKLLLKFTCSDKFKTLPILNLDGVKIHFGCGPVNFPGWINIDALSNPHIHLAGSLETLNTFNSDSVDLIYACHVLEHLNHVECSLFLDKAYKILKPGGCLLLSVPDFKSLANLYLQTDNLSDIHPAIFGGQDYEFNYHKQGFDRMKLTNNLIAKGFQMIEDWNSLTEFGLEGFDWSSKKITLEKKEYFISLNLKSYK